MSVTIFMNLEINGNNFVIKKFNRSDLNNKLIHQWKELELRSFEGNAYLSPHFILPAIKYLTPSKEIYFIFIYLVADYKDILTGFGVFEYSYGTKQFPLPHLKSYLTIHSYLSGLLIDSEFVDSTLAAFFEYTRKFPKFCCGIEFIKRPGQTDLAKRIDLVAAQISVPWHQYNHHKRAILIPKNMSQETIDTLFSKRKKKNLRHCRNQLTKIGEVQWHYIPGDRVDNGCIDRFLQLENMGWKCEKESSLLANPDYETFFREMVAGFSKNNQVFFTELLVDGRSIASTANLLSANSGFAFKIGWDTAFAAASPGILNEIEFIKEAAELLPQIEYIDSGAGEGSFIEKIWVDNYLLVSGFFLTKSHYKILIYIFDFFRNIKRFVNKLKYR